MKVAAVILAAGRASRFGPTSKLLAPLAGRALISHVAQAACAARLDARVAVVAPDSPLPQVLAHYAGIATVVNDRAEDGLSSSLRTGIAALAGDVDGVVILHGDMPLVSAALLDALRRAFETSGGSAIVYPAARDGRQGNPVLWPRALFDELRALDGDRGGKALLAAYADRHRPVIVEGDHARAAFTDVDTIDDLERVTRVVSSSEP